MSIYVSKLGNIMLMAHIWFQKNNQQKLIARPLALIHASLAVLQDFLKIHWKNLLIFSHAASCGLNVCDGAVYTLLASFLLQFIRQQNFSHRMGTRLVVFHRLLLLTRILIKNRWILLHRFFLISRFICIRIFLFYLLAVHNIILGNRIQSIKRVGRHLCYLRAQKTA